MPPAARTNETAATVAAFARSPIVRRFPIQNGNLVNTLPMALHPAENRGYRELMLTAEEARGHPDSNKVLRSLGGQRELPDGYVDSLEAALGQSSLQLEPGDWIVLCSDGVWGSVQDAKIQAIVVAAADCPTVARVLVERALEAGAPDNAATVVARCVRMPAA